jgi:hypothetical protein
LVIFEEFAWILQPNIPKEMERQGAFRGGHAESKPVVKEVDQRAVKSSLNMK